MCDANYKFSLVDIGDSGRQIYGSVYNNIHLGHAIENNLLQIPECAQLPNSLKLLPFVFIADDAYMMKPYPLQHLPLDHRIFNSGYQGLGES